MCCVPCVVAALVIVLTLGERLTYEAWSSFIGSCIVSYFVSTQLLSSKYWPSLAQWCVHHQSKRNSMVKIHCGQRKCSPPPFVMTLDNGERVHSSSVWSMRIYFYAYCETYLFFVFLHICWQIFVNVGFYLCPFIHLMNECIKVASYLSETLPMLVCKWHSFLSFCYLVC